MENTDRTTASNNFPIHAFRAPLPFDLSSVNSYFIPGPEPTLIDVPPDERGAKEYLETALGDLGCRIEDITRILVTHPHLDHYGAAAWVVERSGAKVWISREAAGYLERPAEEMEKDFRYYCRFMEWAGTPEKGEYYLRDFFEAAKRFGPGVEVAGYLEEGDRIKCGSSSLTVISVPGHTPWCTLFYDAQRRLGFTGDFLIKDISSNATVHKSPRSHERYKSLKTYISSLRKVRALGIGAAFPGHGDRIDDVEGRIDEVLALISDRKRLIRAILKEGPSTPYGIMSRIFPKLPNFHVMLGISEVVGHLEILEEEGEVKRDKGSSVYRPAQGRG